MSLDLDEDSDDDKNNDIKQIHIFDTSSSHKIIGNHSRVKSLFSPTGYDPNRMFNHSYQKGN